MSYLFQGLFKDSTKFISLRFHLLSRGRFPQYGGSGKGGREGALRDMLFSWRHFLKIPELG